MGDRKEPCHFPQGKGLAGKELRITWFIGLYLADEGNFSSSQCQKEKNKFIMFVNCIFYLPSMY